MICDAALCVLEIANNSLSAVSGLQKWMHDRVRGKLWADMCKLGKIHEIVVLVFLCLQCSQEDVLLSVEDLPLVH